MAASHRMMSPLLRIPRKWQNFRCVPTCSHDVQFVNKTDSRMQISLLCCLYTMRILPFIGVTNTYTAVTHDPKVSSNLEATKRCVHYTPQLFFHAFYQPLQRHRVMGERSREYTPSPPSGKAAFQPQNSSRYLPSECSDLKWIQFSMHR